jgi:hypothetical protein
MRTETPIWNHPVLTAKDVNGWLSTRARILVPTNTIITPLAHEELRRQQVVIEQYDPEPTTWSGWMVGMDRPYPMVLSALRSLRQQGVGCRELPLLGTSPREALTWLIQDLDCGGCCGAVLFSHDPALLCCLANRNESFRACPVGSIQHAARALDTCGANLLAVEMPHRTYFEIRQVLTLATQVTPVCPPGLMSRSVGVNGAHR